MFDPARPSVLFLCPDTDVPTGGIQAMYRQVEIMNRAGISAAMLHERPGFRCSWFEHDAPVVSTALRPITQFDVLAIPEVYGPNLHELAPGTKKVVVNQNAFLTFVRWPLPGQDGGVPAAGAAPYRSPEVVAAICVSEQNREYLEHAFPGVPVHRIVYEIAVPEAVTGKDDVVAFMPRKNRDHALQVLSILRQREALEGFDVVAIDGVAHHEALETLARARVFLSFGYPEGCGIPPLEAMAAGCVVVGYDGGGGREYLTAETGYPVAYGDIVEYARTVEAVVGEIRAGHDGPHARARAGRAYVERHHHRAAAAASTTAAWNRIIEQIGAYHVRVDAPLPEVPFQLRTVSDPLRLEIEQLRQELQRAGDERDAAVGERDRAAEGLDALLASSSWRITGPLRKARDAVRRAGSRGVGA